ncbi:patatin-like phospholipase family protein [Amycolatopsis sp. K13G38]|uniref:Patatin-like phospholipase family protein n=1 Tax=Amycolatopsis acididurans TaxID=2724524 RepID=A0ABX1J114_9PSEU|nr:patatin-like phospholipase family protein [Amycolatopsis acididurans]NKQ52040.1 patatin-like phospholipase family protein [Amycolatopsis acididurans]
MGNRSALLRPAENRPGRRGAAATVAVAIIAAAAGPALYLLFAPHVGIIGIQLGGAAQPTPLPPGTAAALWWDFVLVAGYGLALLLGTTAAVWVSWTPRTLELTRFARIAAVVVILSEVVENVLLLAATSAPSPWLLHCAAAAAIVKFSALLPAGLTATYGLATTLWRCTIRERAGVEGVPAAPLEDCDFPESAGTPRSQDRWSRGFSLPDGNTGGGVGFCLSGGGIRAASVAMGALQTLREQLLGARYLVSVSGGGFTAGALQQVLTTAAGDRSPATPADAYEHGSVEEDHVRRHVSYLADSIPETLTAFGVLARGLVLSLIALFSPAIVAGVLAGWLYQRVPVIAFPQSAGDFPEPRAGALLAAGVTAALALAAALSSRTLPLSWRQMRGIAARLGHRLALIAAVVTVLAIALPVLVWLAYALLATTGSGVRIGSPVGAVLLSYLSSLASILWRKRTLLGQSGKDGGITAAVPSSLLQRILVIVTTVILGLAWLLLFVLMIGARGDAAALWTAAGAGVLLVIVGGLLDETSLSLHPFYRERVARTFAVRRISRDGTNYAAPYPPDERTSLSRYASRVPGFPQVIFAAAANLTGEGRTPPGLNAVSFTMSGDWIGGPDVGWMRTAELERAVPRRFQRDLTVQGAVAVSGAAFASAMGRAARWFQVLLAVSGARLGAWLPNPAFVLATPGKGWAYPRLPHARRLPYLWREVFGLHAHHDRLLHITDGGHYDNLGLVELLRRRCERIYAIDVSSDAPPTASSLAYTLALAEQELGVRVVLRDPWTAEPGTADPLEPQRQLSVLNPRLARDPVIVGDIHYPPESGLPEQRRTGLLIVARTLLWRDLPYPLLSYAAHNPEFPHDSTGDQFFNDGKFTAYTELGRQLGLAVRAREKTLSADEVVAAQGKTD